MRAVLLVCLGGAVGSGARYLISSWLQSSGSFPWGTLAVNVVGSFALAGLMQAGVEAGRVPEHLQLALGAGVLGGFTTYSAFNYETFRYLQDGAWGTAALYLTLTMVVCLAAGFLGILLARALT